MNLLGQIWVSFEETEVRVRGFCNVNILGNFENTKPLRIGSYKCRSFRHIRYKETVRVRIWKSRSSWNLGGIWGSAVLWATVWVKPFADHELQWERLRRDQDMFKPAQVELLHIVVYGGSVGAAIQGKCVGLAIGSQVLGHHLLVRSLWARCSNDGLSFLICKWGWLYYF